MHHNLFPAADVPDFTTPEGLRQVLTELNAAGTWSSSPIATALMVRLTSRALFFLPGRAATDTAAAAVEIRDGLFQRLFVKIRPERLRVIPFRVSAVPNQNV